jgi:hypothetical protein
VLVRLCGIHQCPSDRADAVHSMAGYCNKKNGKLCPSGWEVHVPDLAWWCMLNKAIFMD